jgi:glycosyltransferase involved in cell wall biosynthesis
LEHAIKFSKCVLLENNYTKEYAEKFNKNILVITGPIDTLRYFPKPKLKPDTKIVLGWIGSPTTSSYLEPLYNIFETLSQKYSDLVIKLVGFSPGTSLKRPNIIIKKWTLKTEVADLQSFDIGLMPLPDNDWSRGKGGYKLLQYMAVGIPCVASPVGVNKQIIEEGKTGFIVNTPEEWLEKISILVEDRNLREKMGIEGRKKAEAIYSYQANVVKLVDLLRKLSDVQ